MEPATHSNLKPGIPIYFTENENLGPSNDNVVILGKIEPYGIIEHNGKIKVINTTRGDFIIIDETRKKKEAPISFFIKYRNFVEIGRYTATLYVDKILPKPEPQPND